MPVASKNSLILCDIDSKKCLKHSSEILVNIDTIASHSCCILSAAHLPLILLFSLSLTLPIPYIGWWSIKMIEHWMYTPALLHLQLCFHVIWKKKTSQQKAPFNPNSTKLYMQIRKNPFRKKGNYRLNFIFWKKVFLELVFLNHLCFARTKGRQSDL